MAVSAANAARTAALPEGLQSKMNNEIHPYLKKYDIDDAALTGNEGADVDMTRVIVVDEEAMLEAEEEMEPASRQEVLETLKLLMSGGVAGAFSKSCTAPLARLTILYQIKALPQQTAHGPHPNSSLGVLEAMRGVVRREGLRSLWKGNGVTIIHRLPYSAANFWAYETVNELWKKSVPPGSPLDLGDVPRRLIAGGAAGLTACALAYPLDLVRTRLAAQTTQRYYHGIGHTLATIVRDEGAAGLYRGLGATMLQVGPCLAINYASYETLRSAWLSRSADPTTPTIAMSLACGSMAGLVSSTATFPLDLVRRRLQVQGQGGGAKVYGSYLGAFKTIATTEGLRGLYSGILPEYYKVVPGVAIAFCVYEMMKRTLKVETNATGR